MKKASLLTTAFLLSQSLFLTTPDEVNAQLSCQETVNNVVNQIRSKGVPEARASIDRGTANDYNVGNPTNRQDILNILLTGSADDEFYVIENIMNSTQLLNSWANSITQVCGGTAVVRFGVYRTDWSLQYAVQSDSTTVLRQCVNASETTPVYWNETRCIYPPNEQATPFGAFEEYTEYMESIGGRCIELIINNRSFSDLCPSSFMYMTFKNGRVAYVLPMNLENGNFISFSGWQSEQPRQNRSNLLIDTARMIERGQIISEFEILGTCKTDGNVNQEPAILECNSMDLNGGKMIFRFRSDPNDIEVYY